MHSRYIYIFIKSVYIYIEMINQLLVFGLSFLVGLAVGYVITVIILDFWGFN
jgi:hypothetical protein